MPLAGPPKVGGNDPATCCSRHVVVVQSRCLGGSTTEGCGMGDSEQDDPAELELGTEIKAGGDEDMKDRMKRFACSLEPARFATDT